MSNALNSWLAMPETHIQAYVKPLRMRVRAGASQL